MAFGFPPKYIRDFQLDNLHKEQFLVLAIEAALKLEWNVSFVSETGFIAYTKFSWSSWSEEVTVKVLNGVINLKSECTGSQLMDWGKNRDNVEALLGIIDEVKSVMTQEEIKSKLAELRHRCTTKRDEVLINTPSTTMEKITAGVSIVKPTG